jgi:hypothetical protein
MPLSRRAAGVRERRPSPCREISTARFMLKAARSAAGAGDCAGASLLASWVIGDLIQSTDRIGRPKRSVASCAVGTLKAIEEAAEALAASASTCRPPRG